MNSSRPELTHAELGCAIKAATKPKLSFRVMRQNELYNFKSQRFPVRAVADYMGKKITVVIGLQPLFDATGKLCQLV